MTSFGLFFTVLSDGKVLLYFGFICFLSRSINQTTVYCTIHLQWYTVHDRIPLCTAPYTITLLTVVMVCF